MEILVIGAGFAGVWAAVGAARQREQVGLTSDELRITVAAPGESLVIRPRLYEEGPEAMRIPLSRILRPVDAAHLACTVTEIDQKRHCVAAVATDGKKLALSYDRLVLATGSKLRRPANLAGADLLHSVDTLPEAITLDAHLRGLPKSTVHDGRYTAVVVGAGFTGIEVATALVGRLRAIAESAGDAESARVVLVERLESAGIELGAGPRPYIDEAIEKLDIEVRANSGVSRIERAQVVLQDGSTIAAQTVVWTAGMSASSLTQQLGVATDSLGRLPVDEYLQVVGVRDVFAAGDTAAAWADSENRVFQSCQHAIPQGKFAGHNAVASIFGTPLQSFQTNPYVTCLDLGSWGAVFTKGWDREVDLTGVEGKRRKQLINGVRIYPPIDDREELFRQADPEVYRLGTSRLS